MKGWNVVVSVREGRFSEACGLLENYGAVSKTEFYNVLVMQVHGVQQMLDAFHRRTVEDLESLSCVSRLVPVTHTFCFQTSQEFEAKAKETVLAWVPKLGGKSFHVRMHRRGFKAKLSSPDEEHFLDDVLLEALKNAGLPGRMSFENPDAIIVVETVGPRAGLSFWEREDMQRYPFLRLD